ncbi:ATP-binding cassette domain-containing protein [Candidatus Albibeggiatoa sp. nov. NOAA]|uniref:ABC transporter ATP-binding protein n=1 Tax=Candidatus Albibeggiatoa sp. nov. NOAA TaxID=3162724 RepID=UPI0032F5EB78|nr:ATP-binding cassette domain-containing protein [Thiotrichaceae bacterium]
MTALKAKNLTLQRGQGQNSKSILSGEQCDFELQQGEFVHLKGDSGVGKSSLLSALARLIPIQAGELYLYNQSAKEIEPSQWRQSIAFLPQKPIMFTGTVEDNLLYPFQHIKVQQKTLPTHEQLGEELSSLGLNSITLQQQANTLSGGQQARLALARLLITQPQIILADEPMANVDVDTADLIYKRLQQFCAQDGTVLITRHGDLQADKYIYLQGNGQLVVEHECN